jgi:HPt (histidine-containing phosphotransfer) domain-containing protein
MNAAFVVPKELRRRYLERRSADLELLDRAITEKNYREFNRIGHQLRGNAPSYGFEDLSDVGLEIETAGKSCDGHKARKAVLALKNWLSKVIREDTA